MRFVYCEPGISMSNAQTTCATKSTAEWPFKCARALWTGAMVLE